jgi:hypothetical protein
LQNESARKQDVKTLIKPENEAEALVLKVVLQEHGIEATIISFHDTAYDGLYQSQYGWGVIRVKESDYLQAQRVISEWKHAAPEDVAWEDKE